LEEALRLLEAGVPLGGGTELTSRRSDLEAVIDLTRLSLDRVVVGEQQFEIGATSKLQALVEADLPPELVSVCRLEAGWNLRNQASVAGTIVASDGRSPLVTTLLAMGAELLLEPGSETIELDRYLNARPKDRLITGLRLPRPAQLRYEQVARAPADRPQVCLAVAAVAGTVRVALGGFGPRSQLIAANLPMEARSAEVAAEAARQACSQADDAWASAEYRAVAAAALARRSVLGVLNA
jgi:CO/xanthine dehydrogenase FAD-binding subunit